MLLCILRVPDSEYYLAFGGDYPGCIFFTYPASGRRRAASREAQRVGCVINQDKADFYAAAILRASMRASILPSKEYTGFMHAHRDSQ